MKNVVAVRTPEPREPALSELMLSALSDELRSRWHWLAAADNYGSWLTHLHIDDLAIMPALRAELNAALRPASPTDVVRECETLCETLQVGTDMTPHGWASYIEALEDLPLDLLIAARKRLTKVHKWRTTPMPADWLSQVQPELLARQRASQRVRLLLEDPVRAEAWSRGYRSYDRIAEFRRTHGGNWK